jgi:hypothetical protein
MRRAAAVLLLALAATAAQASDAPKTDVPNTSGPKTSGPAAQTTVVAYADLRAHVGEHVSVRSRFRSTRSGTLTHWTPAAITLRLDAGAELEMPADTIRQASLTPAPAAKPSK